MSAPLQKVMPDVATLMAPLNLPMLVKSADRPARWRVRVEEMIDAFSSIAKFKYELAADVSDKDDQEVQEGLRAVLALVESSLIILEDVWPRKFRRTLALRAPEWLHRYDSAYAAALARMRELKVVLCFLLEEDDEEAERALRPRHLPAMPAAPAVSFSLD